LLGRSGIGPTDVDGQINGHPRPGDSLPLKLAIWICLYALTLLIFFVVPGLIRRYVRDRTFRAVPIPVGYEQPLGTGKD
jgi:hypothetical protein